MQDSQKDIFEILKSAADPEKAADMATYMRNLFPFLGLPTPRRRELSKAFLNEKKKERTIDWDFVSKCYSKSEREYHYLAIDYLASVKKLLVPEDISKIKNLITQNSWWDSVDSIDSILGDMVLRFPRLKQKMLEFAASDNIWLRRSAIDFQLQHKDKTDTELLEKIIMLNLGSNEFFINKAIGWILRDYSKTNKQWVKEFITAHALSPLSRREGSKYI